MRILITRHFLWCKLVYMSRLNNAVTATIDLFHFLTDDNRGILFSNYIFS
jgi:hypothetical protein